MHGRARLRAEIEIVLLVASWVVLAFVLPHAVTGDDAVRFADIEALIHHGTLLKSPYSLIGPLLSTPVLLLGEVVGSPGWWAGHFNAFLVGIALVAGYRVTRGRVEAAFYRTFALLLLMASFLTERLRDYDTEIVTAVLVAFGLVAVAARRHELLGWAAIVVGAANTPAAVGALALVVAAVCLDRRQLQPLLAIGAYALLVLGEAWLRRGSPFTTGYQGDHGARTVLPYSGKPGFSYPFVLGVVAILFSFGRGLLFFTPGLVFGFGRRTRLMTLMLLFVAGLVLVYARWWAWYGGGSWGPRFFVFAAIPSSLLLAPRLRREEDTLVGDLLTLVVLVLSAWVAFCGLVEDPGRFGFCGHNNYRQEFLCWYTPDYSALWWPFIRAPVWTWTTVTLTVVCAIVFLWLAVPLVLRLVRAFAVVRRELAYGWRF